MAGGQSCLFCLAMLAPSLMSLPPSLSPVLPRLARQLRAPSRAHSASRLLPTAPPPLPPQWGLRPRQDCGSAPAPLLAQTYNHYILWSSAADSAVLTTTCSISLDLYEHLC